MFIVASAVLGNAAETTNTVLWTENNISLTTQKDISIDAIKSKTEITLQLDISNWGTKNSPIGWISTNDNTSASLADGYKKAAATFGYGRNGNDAQWCASTFTTGGTFAGQAQATNTSATSYGGSEQKTIDSTVLFITVSNGTATMYEKALNENTVVKVAQTNGMNTSGFTGLHIGIWTTDGVGARTGTMNASIYDGILTTDDMNNILSVPEPSMFGVLAGLGALALVGARRRRK